MITIRPVQRIVWLITTMIAGAGLVAICAVFLSNFARAGSLAIYEHNGSVVGWFVVGDAITATYHQPRSGMATAGVREGTVLFAGVYEGSRIVGTAYAFKRGCSAAPYSVIGEEVGQIIVLRGPSPVRASDGCSVVRYSVDSPNAELVFKYSSTHH